MLRKGFLLILALLVSALAVVGIDGLRRERAIERLEKESMSLADWHYRFSGVKIAMYPPPRGTRRGFLRRMISSPRQVHMYARRDQQQFTLDRTFMRDLALLEIEDLMIIDCRGLSPDVVSGLAKVSSIRVLLLYNCDITNEGMNSLWSQLPNLEVAYLSSGGLGDEALQNVEAGHKLKKLYLPGPGFTNQAIEHLAKLPHLEELNLNEFGGTEDSVPLLAAMPSLRIVSLLHMGTAAAFRDKLQVLNPGIKVRLPP